jgi:hypothetical protein
MQKYRLIRDDNSEVSEMLVHGVRVEYKKILSKKVKGTINRQSRIKDLELAKSKIEIAKEMLIGATVRVISKENKESMIFISLAESAIFSYARCFTDGSKTKLDYKAVYKGHNENRLRKNHLEVVKYRHDAFAHPRDEEVISSGAYAFIDNQDTYPFLQMITNCHYVSPSLDLLNKAHELMHVCEQYLLKKQVEDIDKQKINALKNPTEYGVEDLVNKLNK